MGLSGILEPVALLDVCLDGAGSQGTEQRHASALEIGPCGCETEQGRTRHHQGARPSEARGCQRFDRAGRIAIGDPQAAWSERCQTGLGTGFPDTIERNVHACSVGQLTDFTGDVSAGENRIVCTKITDPCSFLFGRDNPDNTSAERLRPRHEYRPDSAGSSPDPGGYRPA